MERVKQAVTTRLQDINASPALIYSFQRQLDLLMQPESAVISEADIIPVTEVPELADYPDVPDEDAAAALAKVAVLKLNGGLGTTMGVDSAKSLLEVHGGFSFLDLITKQISTIRAEHEVELPLYFLNSFKTEADSIAKLKESAEFSVDAETNSLLQNQVPRLDAKTLRPIKNPDNPEAEWCPPGHGDLFLVLFESGVLKKLAAEGYEILQVSNSDNLGATVCPRIATNFLASESDFLMEVASRTVSDRKGGHLVKARGGEKLRLRESAQVATADVEAASDISRHQFFNTNTIWLKIPALLKMLTQHEGVLPLPLIRNVKPHHLVFHEMSEGKGIKNDTPTTDFIQLESALGSAIELFDNASLLHVPRSRFSPVKTCDDLLLRRSDCYSVSEAGELVRTVDDVPYVQLDPRFYNTVQMLEERFETVPSLQDASVFKVFGNCFFGADVVVHGNVELIAGSKPEQIAAGSILSGD